MAQDRYIRDRIHLLGIDQLQWPFRGEPNFNTRGPSSHVRSHSVDPFPCYHHDVNLVAEMAEIVESRFPVGNPVDYFVTQREDLGRTNGYADKTDVYDHQTHKSSHWEASIILIGKRIPPHPAMTRYLVAHEYGHVVQWWLEGLRCIDSDRETTELDLQYVGLRPGSHNDYGGLKWHANVGELIANDFRILVCGVEEEFWPHPGFDHPRAVPAVRDFWEQAVAENAAKEK